MIKNSIVAIFVLMVTMFFATENSFAQNAPSPDGCIRIMGVETEGCKKGNNNGNQGTGNKTGVNNPQYTAQQVYNMKQWISYWDNEINKWFAYRDQTVAPYYNDPTYYQWARNEYERSNKSIRTLQQNKAVYQNALQRTGQY